MIPNNDSDSTLSSTFDAITSDCPQIRILVLGKTGCGKSSLINKVFGVEKDLAKVSHDRPGEADINREFRHPSNNRFIVHDSEGFEPGQDAKFNTVKRFIEERDRSEIPKKDRLHVVWICISVPMANDRVVETGVKEIFNIVQGRSIPAIVVFTKYDKLATAAILEASDYIHEFSDEEVWWYLENKAKKAAETLCICPWRKEVGKAPLMVSIHGQFKETIQELIKATDEEIQQHSRIFSHTELRALNFAAAQQMNLGIKIDASIGIARLKLLSKPDFMGKQLRQCLDVIHRDIVRVWNIRNSSYLAGDDFKVKMSVLVDDLVANPNTPTPSDGLTVATVTALGRAASESTPAVLNAKWLFDVYQNTSHNIACVMAYIVDLTILMHRLFEIRNSKERHVIPTLQDYAMSEEIAQVHNDIRTFSGRMLSLSLEGNDAALTEIIRLIEKHRQYHVTENTETKLYLKLMTKLLIRHAARLTGLNHGTDHFAPGFGKIIKHDPQAIELDVEDWEQTLSPLLNTLDKLLVPSNIDSLMDKYCHQCQFFQTTYDTLTHFKSLQNREDPVVEKCLKSLEEIILYGNPGHQNFGTNFRPVVFGSVAIAGILMAVLAHQR